MKEGRLRDSDMCMLDIKNMDEQVGGVGHHGQRESLRLWSEELDPPIGKLVL